MVLNQGFIKIALMLYNLKKKQNKVRLHFFLQSLVIWGLYGFPASLLFQLSVFWFLVFCHLKKQRSYMMSDHSKVSPLIFSFLCEYKFQLTSFMFVNTELHNPQVPSCIRFLFRESVQNPSPQSRPPSGPPENNQGEGNRSRLSQSREVSQLLLLLINKEYFCTIMVIDME